MPKTLGALMLLVGASCIAVAQTADIPLTLADGETAWASVVEGAGRVTWGGAGATAEASLTPEGGAAGLVARLDPAPAGLVDISLLAAAEGSPELVVQFTREPAKVPAVALWSLAVTGAKAQRLAARLAPPVATADPLYLYLGARGTGTLRISDVALVAEALPPPVDTTVKAPLPDGWAPDGVLDAQARDVAGTTELLVEVNGLQLSIEPDTSCALGGFAPLSAFVLARGNAPRKLTIEGEFPEGVVCDPREYEVAKSGTSRAHLRIQGLVPGTYAGRVTASSGKESASLPMHVTVSRNYPAFGTTAAGASGAHKWQLQEILVRAAPDSTAQALLAQIEPALARCPAIPLVLFEGLPSSAVLRELVGGLKGRAGLYSAAWRPNRPYAGDAPQAEAEALLPLVRELSEVVSTTDVDAACVSPVFDHTANVAGSPENGLLDACLAMGMSRHFAAVVVTAAPLPPGGVLGESRGGPNPRESSRFWAELDDPCYPHGIEALMEKHDASLPILTSNIGGPAGVDERLDAIKVARAMAIAAYAGATGATFAEAPEAGRIALTRADGSLSPSGRAVQELGRELAGAVPIRRSWAGGDIPGVFGDPVVALPFVRETEALLVLWNNTSVAQPLTLTLHQVPYSEHVLTISRDDPFIDRAYEGHFEFSKRAIQAKRQDVYLTVAPLEVKVLRYRLELALPTWIDSLAYTPRPKSAPPTATRDDRPWWQQLRDWAEGVE